MSSGTRRASPTCRYETPFKVSDGCPASRYERPGSGLVKRRTSPSGRRVGRATRLNLDDDSVTSPTQRRCFGQSVDRRASEHGSLACSPDGEVSRDDVDRLTSVKHMPLPLPPLLDTRTQVRPNSARSTGRRSSIERCAAAPMATAHIPSVTVTAAGRPLRIASTSARCSM